MSISGITKNSVPLWAVNSDQVILADGTVGLPSARFKNALASGIYQSNGAVGIASNGIQCGLFSPSEQVLTGQVTTNTLSPNSVICGTGNITHINSTSAVVSNRRIPTGAQNNYLLRSDATGNASWTAPSAGLSMTQYRIVGIDNITLSAGSVVTLDILCTKLVQGSDVTILMNGLLEFSASISSGSSLDIDFTEFYTWTGFQSMTVMRGTVSARSTNLDKLSAETSMQGDTPRIRLKHGSGGGTWSGGTIEFSMMLLD
jgi:hypothetical protein